MSAVRIALFLLFLFYSATVLGQGPNITYPTPQVYRVNTPITTLTPTNTGGAVPATVYGTVTTLAGNGTIGHADGQGAAASFNQAEGLAVDADNNVYATDYFNNTIRKITQAGLVTTFAGSYGNGGYADGSNAAAKFSGPEGLAFDGAGNLLVGDELNDRIRIISPQGQVGTYLGTGTVGYGGGPAHSATFSSPWAMAFAHSGLLYIVDINNNLIRQYGPGDMVTTLAGKPQVAGYSDGTGAAAIFNYPTGITADANDNLYVSDGGNNLIRKITPAGVVTTFAGSLTAGNADGTGTAAAFSHPYGIVADAVGNLYVSDQLNNEIRRINPAGVVVTIAGSGIAGAADGVGKAASFHVPVGLALDKLGNLFVADVGNGMVRKIVVTGYTIDKSLPAGLIFDPATGIITGTPTVVTPAADYTITAYNKDGSNSITLNISVAPQAAQPAPNITYPTPQVYTITTAITPISPTNTGGPVAAGGYAIDKPLPAGLTFDPNTGIISGTPTVGSAAANYTITATNSGGSSPFVINITVKLKSSIISFPDIPQNSLDANHNLTPTLSSTNNETPIVLTSSDTNVATILPTGQIHFLTPGLIRVTATQAGDANYNPAEPVYQDITVTQQQALYLPPIPQKLICDADFSANALTNSVGASKFPITYTSSDPNVATISAQGVIHVMGIGSTTITINEAGDGVYYLAAAPQSQILNVGAPAAASLTISPNFISTCVGLPVTYTATARGQGPNPGYQWQVNGVNVTGATTTTFTSSILHTNDMVTCVLTYIDECMNQHTVTANATLTADSYLSPSITIAASANSVCSGAPITFSATPVNGTGTPLYQWKVNGADVSAGSAYFTTYTLNDGDLVTCTLTVQGGKCLTLNTASSNVVVAHVIANTTPVISINSSATHIFEGMTVAFTAISNAGAGASYQWQINGAAVGTNSTLFSTNRLKNGDKVTCTVLGTAACILPEISQPIIMAVTSAVDIPVNNTITPNGDGINDVWSIPALTNYPGCVVDIYNRLGTPLFHSNGYGAPWDGTTSGKPVPVGTYYFIINLGYNNQKVSGSITVIR